MLPVESGGRRLSSGSETTVACIGLSHPITAGWHVRRKSSCDLHHVTGRSYADCALIQINVTGRRYPHSGARARNRSMPG